MIDVLKKTGSQEPGYNVHQVTGSDAQDEKRPTGVCCMEQSTIAIIILASALVLYSIPRIPLSVTTMIAILAMAFSGILTFPEAFSGFASTAVILVAGMMVIGHTFLTCGLAKKIGFILYRFVGSDEKKFTAMIIIIALTLAILLNGALVVAMLMPIIDSVASQSKGKITRKHTYFPLGFASTIGNNLTMISATSMITAAGLMSAAGYGQLGLFAPTVINLPAVVVVVVLYLLFGYRLQNRWFDFEEVPLPEHEPCSRDNCTCTPWKMVLTTFVMFGVIIMMLSGVHYGAAALIGATILVASGCISEKEAFSSISWPTVLIVGGAIGISKGLDVSGAGVRIAQFVIDGFGPLGHSPFGLCLIFCILGSLLSNLMSDNATVAILVPIAISLSAALGFSPIPLVLATASGIKVAVATPISVAPMTMVQVPGYRFKDYFKIGGLINITSILVTSVVIKLVYFM